MDDVESGENEAFAEEEEAEYPDNFTSQLIMLAKSAARQTYCCISVLIFPAFSPLFDLTWTYWSENYTDFDEDVVSLMSIRARSVFAVSICGLIVGGILLHFIGRKLTVIVANFLEMVFLLYVYLTDTVSETDFAPSNITMLHNFVTGIGFVTFFIYLSEIASPTFRAFFMGLYWLMVIIFNEQFYAIILTERVSDLFRNCSIVAAFSLLLSLFILETPFWLALNGNAEKAEETFMWLRAGDWDRSEFDQMLDTANNIMENSFQTFVSISTFVVGMVFCFFLIMGTFNACSLLTAFLYGPWSQQHKWLMADTYNYFGNVLVEHKKHEFAHQVYGQLTFLLFNFLLPRKVLYFMSYIFSFLIVLPWILRIESIPALTFLAPFCNVAPYIGITSLNHILPVEVFPIALREIGVVFAGSLEQLLTCLNKTYLTPLTEFIGSHAPEFENPYYLFISLYISVIGIPFILIFMPETKDMNIYELEELKLAVQPTFRGAAEENEDPVAGDESSAGPDAND